MTLKKLRASHIVVVAMLAFTVYVLVSLYMVNQDIKSRQQDIALLEIQIEQLTEENQELSQIVSQGVVDDEYIEQLAREKLNFVYPDEIVFQDMVGS